MRPLNGPPNHGLSELENAKHKTHRFYTFCGVNVTGFSMHPSGPPAATSAAATMVRVGGRVGVGHDGGKVRERLV